MLTEKSSGIAAIAGTAVLSVCAAIPAALGDAPTPIEDHDRYQPTQSISYEFGSKSTSGYFEQEDGACVVILMVRERSDPEAPVALSPTRVRLMMQPGEVAGLDSEEGRSLNFTCGAGGTTLFVDVGERERLVALQDHALRTSIAEKH
jgi:hypothetical protein